jgi:hypothetical protein
MRFQVLQPTQELLAQALPKEINLEDSRLPTSLFKMQVVDLIAAPSDFLSTEFFTPSVIQNPNQLVLGIDAVVDLGSLQSYEGGPVDSHDQIPLHQSSCIARTVLDDSLEEQPLTGNQLKFHTDSFPNSSPPGLCMGELLTGKDRIPSMTHELVKLCGQLAGSGLIELG